MCLAVSRGVSKGVDKVVDEGQDDDDDGLGGGSRSCGLTRYYIRFRDSGRLLIMWSVPPE
jgi:hypothetical protein